MIWFGPAGVTELFFGGLLVAAAETSSFGRNFLSTHSCASSDSIEVQTPSTCFLNCTLHSICFFSFQSSHHLPLTTAFRAAATLALTASVGARFVVLRSSLTSLVSGAPSSFKRILSNLILPRFRIFGSCERVREGGACEGRE